MNYEQTRYFLFSKSYVGGAIVEEIRKRHNIDSHQNNIEWMKFVVKNHFSILEEIQNDWTIQTGRRTIIDFIFIWLNQDYIESKIFPEALLLAQELNFDRKMLMINVLYDNVPKLLSTPDGIHFASKLRPIREEGIYLKISKNTTNVEIIKMLSDAKKYIRVVKPEQNKNSIRSLEILKEKKRKDISKNDQKKINLFIDVENRIKELVKEKHINGKEYVYETEVVCPAIERVVGDKLAKFSEDKADKYELVWNRKVREIYYSMLNRYQLPTYKQLKPILRVINS